MQNLTAGFLLRTLRQTRGCSSAASGKAQTVSERVKESLTANSAWEAFKGAVQSKLFLIGAVGAFGLFLGANRGLDQWYKQQVFEKVDKGFCPKLDVDIAIERDELKKQLVDIFVQKEPARFFHVVHGAQGTGKSALIQQACHAAGGGVGYLQAGVVPQNDFGQRLGTAINFRFQQHASIFNAAAKIFAGTSVVDEAEGKVSMLSQAARALQTAAREYRRTHGRPFVLVIDDVDRLDDDLLHALQDYAREWAEQHIVVTVLVASNSNTLTRMKEWPSWVRAFEVLNIPELTDQESLQFLHTAGIRGEMAQRVVELVGGRFHSLEKCSAMIKAGRSLDDVACSVLRDAESEYVKSGLLDDTPQQQAGLKVVQAILKSKSQPPMIDIQTWRNLVPSQEMQRALLRGRVFSVSERGVTFASRPMHVFATRQLRQRMYCSTASRESRGWIGWITGQS